MRTMESRGTSGGESEKSQISEGREELVTTNSVALGDVICIKLRGGSWWPAQVVDDNSVNNSIKPRKRSAGDVLVRVYGSYTYFYADPIKCQSEFEMILKRNNGSYRKILQQALEQDLPSTKSCRSKGSTSKTKGANKMEAKRKSYKQDEEQKDLMLEKKRPRSKPNEVQNKVKHRKQNEMLNDDDLSSQGPEKTLLGKSQELSARRIRVMKNLGLIAPPGSPFHKDGDIYNLSS